MNSSEMRKLSRKDLLEILLSLSRENEQLRKENEQLNKQIKEKILAMENCGSIAEASLQLNGVFQAAQSACEQFMQNVRYRVEYQQSICMQIEQETRAKCDAMLANAKMQADAYIEEARRNGLR